MSWFPGVIDPSWAVRDRSTVRLALSQDLAGRARDLLGLEIDDVAFLPGPPASWLEPPYAVRPKARTLLFVGRLEPNKGVRELLTVFEALAPRFPELRLRLAGEGPERAAAERRLATTGFTGRVELLGALGPEEVRRELASADLLVFPSHYESWGLAIVEAMAVGVPVVASDIPGIREVAGRAACLIPVRDASAWVETVGRLIDDPAARRQLSMAGRERAARFTAEGAVEIMEGWLFRACER